MTCPHGSAGSPSWKSTLSSRCVPDVYVLVCGALKGDAPGRRFFCMVVCVVQESPKSTAVALMLFYVLVQYELRASFECKGIAGFATA